MTELNHILSPTIFDDLLTGKHNFAADAFDVYLSPTTDKRGERVASVKATVGNGSVVFSNVLVTPNLDITFRYIGIVNTTSNTLVGYLDYGESTKLKAGDTLSVKLGEMLALKGDK